jgi:hypothetical protein
MALSPRLTEGEGGADQVNEEKIPKIETGVGDLAARAIAAGTGKRAERLHHRENKPVLLGQALGRSL